MCFAFSGCHFLWFLATKSSTPTMMVRCDMTALGRQGAATCCRRIARFVCKMWLRHDSFVIHTIHVRFRHKIDSIHNLYCQAEESYCIVLHESYNTDNHIVNYPQFHLITYRIEFLAGIGLKFVFWHLVLHILSALNIYWLFIHVCLYHRDWNIGTYWFLK